MNLRTLMNLDEFLKENPDTLGCLTQKIPQVLLKGFSFPCTCFVKMRQKYRHDKIQTPLCFFFFSSFFNMQRDVGGGGQFHQTDLNTWSLRVLVLIFFFKTNSALTTNMAPLILFFLTLSLMLRCVKGAVNNLKEDVFNIIFLKRVIRVDGLSQILLMVEERRKEVPNPTFVAEV